MKRTAVTASLMAVALLATACTSAKTTEQKPATTPAPSTPAAPALKGEIKIDGSSTVGPISIAVAEEFQKANKDVKVNVGISGSGAGITKFIAGEIDIADSSRKMKPEEFEKGKAAGYEAVELPVAYDGITVVVNKENSFLDCITVADLKKIWQKDSKVKLWSDVNPAWPKEEIKLFGPGSTDGTFEYFTEHVNGKAKESRTDYTASEDDNVLVNGVAGNKGSMGYFGFAYYKENASKLKAVKIDGGKGCVAPELKTIQDATYPISRQIFIYPSKKALARPEVNAFVTYYLTNGAKFAEQAGYVALQANMYQDGLAKIK
jgi:phosphate transport system substrate-binding protein